MQLKNKLSKMISTTLLSTSTIQTKFIDFKTTTSLDPTDMHINTRLLQFKQGHYLMKIKSIGINRAQCLQRQGKYLSIKQQDKYLGLQASGQIYDPFSANLKKIDGIALLSGGSYSEWAIIPKDHILMLPKTLSYVQGAAIPEAWLTAYQILKLANLEAGNSVVIYAAASGVGTAAIQICKVLGYSPYAVVSSEQKAQFCQKLGAKVVIYKDNQNWATQLQQINNGNQFHAVLDCVGSSNVNNTLNLLQTDGKWILYGLLSGGKVLHLNLAAILSKRIHLISSTLKSRSTIYKTDLINRFKKDVLPSIEDQKIKPIIFKVIKHQWNLQNAQSFVQAHRIMESNQNIGKIIIQYV